MFRRTCTSGVNSHIVRCSYIDYAHRLKTDKNMEAVFHGKRRMMPQPTDLSFFNWETQQSKVRKACTCV